MVISAEPQRQPSDPVVAGGGGAGAAAAEEGGAARARLAPLSSSLKTWGSHRVLRCAPVNRAGDALSPAASRRSSPEELGEVREKLLLSLRDVAAQGHGGGSGSSTAAAAADAEALSVEAEAPPPPWKLRTRRRRPAMAPAAAAASASPSSGRRAVRADALDRPRFSATLTADEIEEDVYALTGARPRRRPRRRPRAVQKQLDSLLPGAWLSEITVDSYRVPDER
ncbi:uncharacterized protein LOC100830090 [Brachypodium distachyon]|uniref:DUF1639 family protein n=1 Tax=Brachypodium distachyon TaxID=15368 RepID=A0A0Q3FT08_BRADI|nr:uncharacterized protein LOC100830090 [Brachypodium distachyon]KQK02544.1 hypothetical protein BRADI_2g02176v3 [Brachypodium distachyon]|eukprot:XP_010232954.1 uncharacterized protein LOC100830090 [Brachypodium distachyon]